MMSVTAENYFSPESNMKYMGSSQFKAFQKCEAAALAELKGEYVRPPSDALLIGSYVDAHFEGTLGWCWRRSCLWTGRPYTSWIF